MRTAVALIAAASLALSLAACSPASNQSTNDTASADCTTTKSGAISDAVKVEGDFGTAPKVTVDGPLTLSTTERTVVIEGDGAVATDGAEITVDFQLLNATTGEVVTSTEYKKGEEAALAVDDELFLSGLVKTIQCSTVGSRVVGVIPPADSWGEGNTEQASQVGSEVDDALVFVVDIVGITPPLEVVDYKDLENAPKVTFADDGEPTVTIPETDPPVVTEIGLISKGDGEVVGKNADVSVHYRGINWNTGEIFDESYARGEPTDFNTGGVVPGFGAAIEGQTVGSRLVAIIAPKDGYGSAGNGEAIGGTDTLVFVIEIVSVK
ncbi:peptidylprolyl isomerase [Glaciihabitans arcticus]|uniref:peptidylprolyl isomerase n=1 Tax=Glaciihabitans arcticus TaxID=2668039 RepID=A0A4Q9GNQ7_9MICO|nr:FKBP-type peptidyl-prolyl cis-trans isomerase [Glaciihabitans arcticus]TBN56351.1 peptidylprolyl isomerase [Glaciihabitans arcticus]